MQYFRIEVVVDDSIFAQFSWFGKRYTGTCLYLCKYALKVLICLKYKNSETSEDFNLGSKLVPLHSQIWGEIVTYLVKIVSSNEVLLAMH